MNLCRILLLLSLAAAAAADTGPILPERTADHLIDSFETDPPAYTTRVRGKIDFKLSNRSGISRDGNRSLLIEMQPSHDPGRNSLRLCWAFDQPVDWSAFAGLTVCFQTHGDPPPNITPVIFERGGASYWWRGPMLTPRREGEWQFLELPFSGWTWNWEASKDENGRLDLNQIKELDFEIRADKDRPITLGMDAVGLYVARPPYSGPIFRFRAAKTTHGAFVFPPGQDYVIDAEVRQLPPGKRADVQVVGTDYWGKQMVARQLTFVGAAENRQRQEIRFPNNGPDYIALTGTLSIGGKPLYRAETGVGCIPPPSPEDAKPDPDSIFGIWVGGGGEKIGAKWERELVRLSGVKKVGDQFQLGDAQPGVPVPKFGWGPPELNRIVCFVDMPKWLSSHPDRADWQKWSPTDWDKYAKVVQFIVRGAKEAGIRHYEVWNEPVPFAGWVGPVESVVKLHEVTYKAIKAVQPDAVVIGPCPYSFVWGFLDEFFKLGGGRWIDQIDMHTYDSAPPDANFVNNLHKLRELLTQYKLGDRDIYITEMGYSTPNVTPHQQADYLVRSYVYAMSQHIRVLVWHMLWDWQGVRDPENYAGNPGFAIQRFERSPRPAYIAYATMTRMLARATYSGPAAGLTQTQRGFLFGKNGSRIRVLWDVGESSTPYRFTATAPKISVANLVGGETLLQPDTAGQYTVTLSADPIYVIAR